MQTLKPYMPRGMQVDQLADFMNKTVMGRVDTEGLKPIRDAWKGPLVIKGLINEQDVEAAIEIGADGVIISNHGGRQLDAGESPVEPLQRIAKKYAGRITIMMDSGLPLGNTYRIGSGIWCSVYLFGASLRLWFGGAWAKRGNTHD